MQEYSLYTEAKDEVALEGEQSKCGFTSVCVRVCSIAWAPLTSILSPWSCAETLKEGTTDVRETIPNPRPKAGSGVWAALKSAIGKV